MATDDQKKRQALRDDDTTSGDAAVVAYKDEDGSPRAWQGDEEMPWVRAFFEDGDSAHVQGAIAHDEPDVEASNFPVKVGGHATAGLRPAVGEDDVADLSVDLQGRLRIVDAGTSGTVQRSSTPGARENSRVAKSTPGTLFRTDMGVVTGTNADRWLMVFDKSVAPVNGDVPIWRALSPAAQGSAEVYIEFPRGAALACAAGVTVGISTTELTYTAPANPEATFHILYE